MKKFALLAFVLAFVTLDALVSAQETRRHEREWPMGKLALRALTSFETEGRELAERQARLRDNFEASVAEIRSSLPGFPTDRPLAWGPSDLDPSKLVFYAAAPAPIASR